MSEEEPSREALRGEAAWGVAITAFYSLLTALYLRPPWGELDRRLAHDVGDPVFNLVVLRWVSDRLAAGLDGVVGMWDAPFFHPTPDALTLSDHLLGPALLALPLRALGASPATAFNLLLLLSFPLAGVCAALVARAAGLSRAGALVAGLVFAFAPHRWQQLSHFQLLQVQWIPLVLWTFDRLLERRTWGTALAFVGAYALHLGGSLYLLLMIQPALAALALPRLPALAASPRRRLLPLALAAIAALALTGALLAPYAVSDSGVGGERGPAEWRRWAATFASYATPPEPSIWFAGGDGASGWRRPENALCLGLVAVLLIAAGRNRSRVALGAPDGDRSERLLRRALGLLALAALVAGDLALLGDEGALPALVPVAALPRLSALFFAAGIGWAVLYLRRSPASPGGARSWDHRLLLAGALSLSLAHAAPFEGLALAVPGFDHLRAPARFFLVASFPLAFFAGRGADALLARFGGARRATAATLLVALVALEGTTRPIPWLPLPEPGAAKGAYAWLAAQNDVVAVIELPCRNRDEDLAAMYLQPLHGKPLVNGFSGHFPFYYPELVDRLCSTTPRPGATRLLRRLGATHLLVHPPSRWTRRGERARIRNLAMHPELELVYSGDGAQILRLRAPEGG